jgi:hypothetical protein
MLFEPVTQICIVLMATDGIRPLTVRRTMQLHRNSIRLTLCGGGEAGSAKQGSDDKMSEERGEDHIPSKARERLRNAEIARKRRLNAKKTAAGPTKH